MKTQTYNNQDEMRVRMLEYQRRTKDKYSYALKLRVNDSGMCCGFALRVDEAHKEKAP